MRRRILIREVHSPERDELFASQLQEWRRDDIQLPTAIAILVISVAYLAGAVIAVCSL